ncbi:MAG: ATP-dependent helicase HrpB [Deferrisomatales bacterium]
MDMHRAPLPIDDHLPRIVAAVERDGAAVVVAPPGSGKTTRIPQAVLDAGLLGDGCCAVLEPRRIAARAAARRVAEERNRPLGGEVGYQVRFDRRASADTRLLFVTEGVLTARLQRDPLAEGIAAVVLDEFHERSVEADLALAFLREIRETVRPDLRVLVLSATLDPGPVSAYLGAAVVHAPGRAHPVEIRYLDGSPADPDLVGRVAAGVRQAWGWRPGGRGDLLAFLPGAGEIRRVARALAPWAESLGVPLLRLHGDLSPRAQDAALRPGPRPRVILSTNVAESSVTPAGVTCVVDSGLAKLLRHDPSSGLDRLELAAVSRHSADQRAGRAGRLGPGVALRLWSRHDERSRPARTPPEILRVDLARPALEVIGWGHRDPDRFPWFEAPEPERLAAARALLHRLGALEPDGRLTGDGEAMRALPLHPRQARLLLDAARRGFLWEGAQLAALLGERELLLSGRAFGPGAEVAAGSSDVLHRLERLQEAARVGFDPRRLEPRGIDAGAARAVWNGARQLRAALTRSGAKRAPRRTPSEEDLLALILEAYPDRVARRREPGSDRLVLVGGRGGRLSRHSGVRRAPFVVAVRMEDAARGPRAEALVRWASRIEPGWLEEIGGLETRTHTTFDRARERVVALEQRCFEDLVLSERQLAPDPDAAARILAQEVSRDPEGILRPGPAARRFLARCRFLAREMPELALPRWTPQEWQGVVETLARGRTGLEELRRADLLRVLEDRLTWEQRRALARHAPERVEVPSGSRLALLYEDQGPPLLPVKIQEVFGWREGPRVAGGRVAVVLHLLGPHGRPLQVTQDLPSFWSRTYPEIRKEMRGRYPKHRWPEDPWSARPSRRTTKAQPRSPREPAGKS